jgi:quercetin dioxygenase-like cupin family protein
MTPTDDDATLDLSPLLSEPFAQAWATSAPPATPVVRERLHGRLQQSLAAEQGLVTVRQRRLTAESVAEGVSLRWLYRAPHTRELRAGEPQMACQIDLAPGTSFDLAQLGIDSGPRECLVLQGELCLNAERLAELDFVRLPASTSAVLSSEHGARVFVRAASAAEAATADEPVHVVRDAEAGWPDFGPGVRRRVLWADGVQAAMLYRTEPGASVPHHTHGHDEECLMVDGEIFLDDVLLQRGDYQLAPAGSGHRSTETDTGVVLFAHGDLDLRFV